MSAAPSFISRRTFGYKYRGATKPASPVVEVILRNRNDEIIFPSQTTFSTLDRIEGTATLTAPTVTRFDEIEIALLGIYVIPLYFVHAREANSIKCRSR